jgi:hypothetical protein
MPTVDSGEPRGGVPGFQGGEIAAEPSRPSGGLCRRLRLGCRMPHEQQEPEPDPRKPEKPDPRDVRAKWLLFAIAVLLGMIVAQIVKRVI